MNLLPQYWQKKLKDEEVFKTVSILGIDVVSVMLAFILMLFLVRLFYSTNIASLEAVVVEKEQQMAIIKVAPVEKDIFYTGKLISAIGEFYGGQTKVTELFSQVSGANPGGIDLTNFTFSLGNISIKGYAADREKLVSFKNNLESRPGFKKVTFPQDSWLRARDISFSATIDVGGSVEK